MIQDTPQADRFKKQMEASVLQETLNSRAVTIAKNANVYACGDTDAQVYLIERGQIKLFMRSPDGKNCLLAIHKAGDIFGELCLSGLDARLETATAMEETVMKQISRAAFFARLKRDNLLPTFVKYLVVCAANQQQIIADLMMGKSEQRLGQALLSLPGTLSEKDAGSIRLEREIAHEELSEMVGATPPSISLFMQRFQNLGLIETDADQSLIIKEGKLTAYLAQIA